MGKTRVGVLLRESMGGNKSSNKSADLAALTTKYQGFCKKVRALILSLKAHHDAMVKLEESRTNVSLCRATEKVRRTLAPCWYSYSRSPPAFFFSFLRDRRSQRILRS